MYFADWAAAAPLAPLGEALEQLQRRGASLVVFVVLPVGAFDARRRELEAKRAAIGDEFSANLHVTEDDQGGWTKTFAPAGRPAVFLINARREFDWKSEGALVPRDLAAALDRRLEVAPPPRPVPLRLTVSPGDRVLDASFADDTGELVALHRLRGHRLVLNFWQAWSEPCRRELRRLSALHERVGSDGPMIVAFHGGPKEDLDRVRKELGLRFTLVQDVDHEVARTYGVRCWPTTITVNHDGRVEHVQFGITPFREREPYSAG